MKNILFVILFVASFSVFGQGQLQQTSVGTMTYNSGKIMQMLEALPDDKLSWSPQEGVRPFSSVFAHVVAGNYFFINTMGGKVPEGINVMALEKELTTKADIKAALEQSNAILFELVNGIADDDLGTKIEFPAPGEFTKASGISIAGSHISEHMGQLIAYFRMNGMTPPWSK